MLAEALLDAEVRIGDLLKQIPKASGGDRRSNEIKNRTTANFDKTDLTSPHQCEEVNNQEIKNDTDVDFEQPIDTDDDKLKTKKQVVEELGFNQKQAERFETMANNKEIVEQVKAEARENEDIPTRSRVLQLVKEKSKEEQACDEANKRLDKAHAIYCKINDAVYKPISVEITEENVGYWLEDMSQDEIRQEEKNINEAIDNLNEIKRIMQNYKGIRRVK